MSKSWTDKYRPIMLLGCVVLLTAVYIAITTPRDEMNSFGVKGQVFLDSGESELSPVEGATITLGTLDVPAGVTESTTSDSLGYFSIQLLVTVTGRDEWIPFILTATYADCDTFTLILEGFKTGFVTLSKMVVHHPLP